MNPPHSGGQYQFQEPGSQADKGEPGEDWVGMPQVPTGETYRPKGTPPNLKPLYWGLGAAAVAFIVVPLLIYLLASGSQARQLSQLQGDWTIDRQDEGGGSVMTIKDGKMTLRRAGGGGDEDFGTFVIDATTAPTTIDVTLGSGPNKGQTIYGLYELDGDRLTICLGGPGASRPLKVDRARGWIYMRLNRNKA